LLKLRHRLSKKSVLQLPAHTYTGVKDLAIYSLPQLKIYVNVLGAIFDHLSSAKQATQQQGIYLSKSVVGYVNHSLHVVAASYSALLNIFKQFDPVEARTSFVELTKMLRTSKDNVAKVIDNFHLAQKLKTDSSSILSHAGEVLSHPLEAGYTYVANSDIAAIKTAFDSLESAIQSIIESLAIHTENSRSM